MPTHTPTHRHALYQPIHQPIIAQNLYNLFNDQFCKCNTSLPPFIDTLLFLNLIFTQINLAVWIFVFTFAYS